MINLITKMRLPVPRPEAYDLYWRFACFRHDIFLRRYDGGLRPWTADATLATFKFCNVFRALDRVSQYMIREIACAPHSDSVHDVIFRIVAFRTFSNEKTWDGLVARLRRQPTLQDLSAGRFESCLDEIKRQNKGLYTGAFILCANKAFGFDEKHKNHVALFKQMFFESQFATRALEITSLQDLVALLQSFPLTGPFMAYQTAIDLNYSPYVNFSENAYTQAGPGAVRGLQKAFTNLGDYSTSDAILLMVENQDREFERLGLKFGGLWGRKLHAIDCQGLFCELDKYCREVVPHLKSNRCRIKTRFNPSLVPLSLTFPEKWKIDVPQRPSLYDCGVRSERLGKQALLFSD